MKNQRRTKLNNQFVRPQSRRQPKVHYKNGGCARGQDYYQAALKTAASNKISDVTCSVCLTRIKKLNLRDRSEFPETPTFHAEHTTKFYASFRCPVCGRVNEHGYGSGRRVSHCPCWKHGYYLEMEAKCKTPMLLNEAKDPTPQNYKEILRSIHTHSSCVVCGAFPVAAVGIYTPSDPEAFGAGPGRVKQFFYGLCRNCFSSGGEAEAERIFRQEWVL